MLPISKRTITGVTTRTTNEDRTCEACQEWILAGWEYERVMLLPNQDSAIVSLHTTCFEDEFGRRELYGD